MKKILLLLLLSALFMGCAKSQKYIIQVSLGGWDKADYTAVDLWGRLPGSYSLTED